VSELQKAATLLVNSILMEDMWTLLDRRGGARTENAERVRGRRGENVMSAIRKGTKVRRTLSERAPEAGLVNRTTNITAR